MRTGLAQQLDTKHALSRYAHTTSKVASESGSTVTESVCDSRPGPGDPGPAGMIIAFDSDFFQSFRVSLRLAAASRAESKHTGTLLRRPRPASGAETVSESRTPSRRDSDLPV